MKTTLDSNGLLAAAKTSDPQAPPKNRKALKKSCQDFEAIFIQSMFNAMRKTVPDSGLLTKDNSTSMYQEMLDQEIATKISQKQSIGLAEQMYRQMEKKLPSAK